MAKVKLQLSRDAWLEHALKILRKEGIQGVRVERIARDLGVTKGSFYWHFSDRNELFAALLDFWSQQYNDVVMMNTQFSSGDPAAGLLAAMIMVREKNLDQYEVAMRCWADQDSKASEAVQKVYQQRTEFVKGLFLRIGFRGVDAEIRTRLTLCFLSWDANMYRDDSDSRRRSLVKRQHELLTSM